MKTTLSTISLFVALSLSELEMALSFPETLENLYYSLKKKKKKNLI